MTRSDIHKTLSNELAELFSCEARGDEFWIETPLLYPDGDVITLRCSEEGDAILVTDLCQTTGWLFCQGGTEARPPEQDRLIANACRTHGVDFGDEKIFAVCGSDDSLADVVIRVAQACLRVSDLSLVFREQLVTQST